MQAVKLLVLVLAGLTAFAAEWSAVAALQPGSKVKVQPSKGPQVSGELSRATSEAICVARRAGEICVDKADVRRVRVRTGKARARNAAIAGGVTAAIWTAFVIIGWSRTSDSDAIPHLLGYGIPFFGGIAAGITALFPAYTTVYNTP